MIYGRPIGIPHIHLVKHQTILPQPIDDRYIARGEKQPDGLPSVNAFFLSTVRLYYVMDEILERLHQAVAMGKSDSDCSHEDREKCRHHLNGSSALSLLTAILQLDEMLLSWHDSLPEYLKFPVDSVESGSTYPLGIQRQRIILKARFLGMRILLHRQTILFLLQPPETRRWSRNVSHQWPPLFSDISSEPLAGCSNSLRPGKAHSSIDVTLAQLSASVCVASALLQIESIDAHRPIKLTGAWWWNFHCESLPEHSDSLTKLT